ncbi:MAG: molybdenum cofactor biosynthesis protein B [Tepidisphaerales bacterium]
MTVAILTISDRCSRGLAVDTSGPALADLAQRLLSGQVVATACVADETDQIAAQLRTWATSTAAPNLILTTGGTGLSPRDVTPEATATVLERRHPQLLELARARCLATSPRAYLSRGEAGTIGRTLVVNLPGSKRGAMEFLSALADVLPHAVGILTATDSEHGA